MTQSLSHSQAILAKDIDFNGRITSVLKDEGFSPPGVDPVAQALTLVADVAAQPGIADAYHAAILAEREDGAIADDVITDGSLLSAVTAVVSSIPSS